MNNEELDLIMGSFLVREITKGLMDDKREKIIYFLIGSIFGLLTGLLVMNLQF